MLLLRKPPYSDVGFEFNMVDCFELNCNYWMVSWFFFITEILWNDYIFFCLFLYWLRINGKLLIILNQWYCKLVIDSWIMEMKISILAYFLYDNIRSL